MQKGIIMEKHRQFTIIMTADGAFRKAKSVENAAIGDEVFYKPIESNKFSFLINPGKKVHIPARMITIVCLVLLLAAPFFLLMDSNKTYAYINIDINPSVELEIDDKLIVHSVTALNDDATILVNKLTDIKGKKLARIINRIMDESEKNGIIQNGKNMLIGVSYADKAQPTSVIENIEQYFATHKSDWQVATFQVPKKIRNTAKEQKKSMNELMASEVEKRNIKEENTETQKPVDDEKKAIINSFYHNDDYVSDKEPKENKEEQLKKEPATKQKDKTSQSKKKQSTEKKIHNENHPSELKEKNNEINSKGKNKKNPPGKKTWYHNKDKKAEKHKNRHHKGNKSYKSNNKNNHDNGKHQKHKREDNKYKNNNRKHNSNRNNHHK